MQEAPVRAGDVLANKYRVDRVLGVGGMGVVVAATHLELDQRVALKFMLPAAFANPEALDRFRREARAAVRLRSEHVARVLDTGTLESGSPYIVMEFLEGTDLAGELEARGPLPVPLVAEYVVQACDALAEAHALGIVHRDLKPANLFLARRTDGSPLVKVLDFGISKANALTEGGLGLTKTAAMMGSPLYMSPEQMKSTKEVDARSDVWSLGVIMYELLGGRVPFFSDTLGALMSMVMMEPHAPLETVRPDLPRGLCMLVNGCLQKNVAQRVPSVAAVARGLAPFCPPRALPIIERICLVLGASPAPTSIDLSPPAPTQLPQPSVPQTIPKLASSAQMPPTARTSGWGATGGPTRTSSAGGWIAVGALALTLLGAGSAFFLVKRRPMAEKPLTQDASAVAISPAPATSASAAADTTTAPAASTLVPTIASAIASAPSTPSASPAVRPVAPPRPPKPPQTHGASAASPATPTPAPPAAPTASAAKPGLLDTSN